MLAAALHLTIDAPWTGMEPLRLGCVPSGLGTPDRYLTIELAGCPLVRCDLYGWRSVESHTFEEVQAWSGLVVVGFGHRLYVIEPVVRKASSFNLGSYFAICTQRVIISWLRRPSDYFDSNPVAL